EQRAIARNIPPLGHILTAELPGMIGLTKDGGERRQDVCRMGYGERTGRLRASRIISVTLAIVATCYEACAGELEIAPASMKAIGTIDARFQSYNIEMVEVTGGRFWKPYPRGLRVLPRVDRDRYSYRPPIDLANARLRKLAAALAPAYVRVSGT